VIQSEFSDLYEHEKRVNSVRLIREIPTESGSRFIQTNVHLKMEFKKNDKIHNYLPLLQTKKELHGRLLHRK
jgi:hypothetical protein